MSWETKVFDKITDAVFNLKARCTSTNDLEEQRDDAQLTLQGEYGELDDDEREGWEHELNIVEKELERRKL